MPARVALLPFVLASLVALGLNAAVLHLGLSVLVLPEVVALALATGSSLGLNFALNKFVVFR